MLIGHSARFVIEVCVNIVSLMFPLPMSSETPRLSSDLLICLYQLTLQAV